MINFKPKIPAMLGALAVLTAGAAHAELLEYTFKAPDGTQRSLTPNANKRRKRNRCNLTQNGS
nr:Protein of uncharacterised function (DUF3607) [Providencia rettgeri]